MSAAKRVEGRTVGLVDMRRARNVRFVRAPWDPEREGIEWDCEDGVVSLWETTLSVLCSDGTIARSHKPWWSPEERFGSYRSERAAVAGLRDGRATREVERDAEKVRGEIRARIQRMRLADRYPSRRRVPRLSATGGKYVLSRVLANEPLWALRHTRGRSMPVLRIAINVARLADVKAERGHAVAAEVACCVAEEVERRYGMSVEILGIACSDTRHTNDSLYGGRGNVSHWIITWPVKRAGERLDRSRVLTLATHAAFRAACMGLREAICGASNGSSRLPALDVMAAMRIHGCVGAPMGAASAAELTDSLLTSALERALRGRP